MIHVTAVRLAGGASHEHITAVRWRNPADQNTGESSREVMVDWINKGGDARVQAGSREVTVGVVKATPPYIQTHADGEWTDNLLALPKF